MSEIKGQLLGIVLVVAVFGVVGGVLVTAFTKSANSIASKITEDTVVKETEKEAGTSIVVSSIITDDNLLTF
jgi:hypothetical protein